MSKREDELLNAMPWFIVAILCMLMVVITFAVFMAPTIFHKIALAGVDLIALAMIAVFVRTMPK